MGLLISFRLSSSSAPDGGKAGAKGECLRQGKGRRGEHARVIPGESLTASSWPFFLVQTYFPLLALSATLWLIHSTENMVLADLHLEVTEGEIEKMSNSTNSNELDNKNSEYEQEQQQQ